MNGKKLVANSLPSTLIDDAFLTEPGKNQLRQYTDILHPYTSLPPFLPRGNESKNHARNLVRALLPLYVTAFLTATLTLFSRYTFANCVLFDTVVEGRRNPAPLAPFRMMRGWKSGASLRKIDEERSWADRHCFEWKSDGFL